MLGAVELSLNDQIVQIPRMAYADFEVLATRWHDEDRKKLLATLESAGVEPSARMEALKELNDDRSDAYFMVASRCFRPTYAHQVIAHCAAKAKVDVSALPVGKELCRKACELCNYDYDAVMANVDKAKKNDGPAPLEIDHPDDLKLARPRLAATG